MHVLELTDAQANDQLLELCKDQTKDDGLHARISCLVHDALCSRGTVPLDRLDPSLMEDAIPLKTLAHMLSKVAEECSTKNCTGLSLQTLRRLGPKPVQLASDSSRDLPTHLVINSVSQ